MKRFSTFPLIDHELNRLDEENTKYGASLIEVSKQMQELSERLKRVEDRKKPGRKPKAA